MKPTPLRGARVPDGDSPQELAFTRLKARYAEARGLLSSAEPHSNLDWILGVNRNPDESSEDLNRKMIPLLALWLEDLAVELERGFARGSLDEADDTAARQACTSAVASLREAASGFAASVRRKA